MRQIQGKLVLLRVCGEFDLPRVPVIGVQLYDPTCNLLEYYGLISPIRRIKGISEKVATQTKALDLLLKSNKFPKTIYKLIIQKRISIPRKNRNGKERVSNKIP